MKVLCCLIAFLITTYAKPAVDVEKTVLQVQNILQANSQLPRLSRHEIIELLNDIRAEDAKSKYIEDSKQVTTLNNENDNYVIPAYSHDIQDNIVSDEKEHPVTATAPQEIEETTLSDPSVMVVLPYTPRDGSSLQELYTKPPRTEVVLQSKISPKALTNSKLQETLKTNAKLAYQQKTDFPAELQAFLDTHGLKGKPGQDNFLLPLEGFKPLPPAKMVDGTVQLPENILLTYDLITQDSFPKQVIMGVQTSPNSFLYEPLRPQNPLELDTSSSEEHKTVLPLDMPKSRKTKSAKPFEPIDYDSVKVIPLNQGPNPVEDEKAFLESEQNKRQANSTTESTTMENKDESVTPSTSTESSDSKDVITNAPNESNDSAAADSNSGASISDLEESFGGAAPEVPGDSQLPPLKKNGFYWMVDWNSFLEVGDGDTKVNIRFEPKLGDPQMFLPVTVP